MGPSFSLLSRSSVFKLFYIRKMGKETTYIRRPLGDFMKRILILSWVLLLSIFVAGCSSNEVIKVGEPFYEENREGVTIQHEITDEATVNELRELMGEAEGAGAVNAEADSYFQIDRPDDHVTDIRRYLWFQEDGSTILYDGHNDYFKLNNDNTLELKRLLDLSEEDQGGRG